MGKHIIFSILIGFFQVCSCLVFSAESIAAFSIPQISILDTLFYAHGRSDDSMQIIIDQFKLENRPMNAKEVAKVLMYQSFRYYPSDSALLFDHLRKAKTTFINQKNYEYAAYCSYHLGYYKGQYGLLNQKQSCLKDCLDLINRAGNKANDWYSFNALNALASVEKDLGNFASAVQYGQKAIDCAEKINNAVYQMRAAINLSSIYGDLSIDDLGFLTDSLRAKYSEETKHYLLEAYDLAETVGNERYLITAGFNLGLYYSEKLQFGQSNDYLDKSIQLAEKLNSVYDLFTAYEIKADNLISQGYKEAADECYNKAVFYADQSESVDIQCRGLLLEAKLAYRSGKNEKALALADIVLNMAVSYNLIRRKQAVYNLLYEINKSTGNYSKALEYYENWSILNKEIVDQDAIRSLDVLRVKYQSAEQEKTIALLEKQNLNQSLSFQKKMYAALGVLFALFTGSLIWYLRTRNQQLQQYNQTIELEQRLLRTQMNPHFTFNTLSSIQKFLLREGEAKQGAYFLAKFSKLVRYILDQSNKKTISLEEERESLENYLTLQKLRFGHSFEFKIDIDQSLNPALNSIPPMLIQPLIENAIEHGKIYAIDNGKVEVYIGKKNDSMEIVVIDNGKGYEHKKSMQEGGHPSVALNIIKERIDFIYKKHRCASFAIEKQKEKGTIAKITLPLLT